MKGEKALLVFLSAGFLSIALLSSLSSPKPPSAFFSASPTYGSAPLDVVFDASGSTDPDGKIVSYDWNFGNGSTGFGKTVSHIFTSPGKYTVELTITGSDGAKDSTNSKIEVTSGVTPDTTITRGPNGNINYREVTFGWTGSDDQTDPSDLRYSYKLEGKDNYFSNWIYDTKKTYTDLQNGEYTFKVKAKDEQGNVDPTSARRTFNVQVPEPGSKKWSFEIKDTVVSSPAISSDGTIYVGSGAGKLYAINSNGTEKWSFKIGWGSIRSSPAIGPGGTIYFGSLDSNLYALNPAGSKKWSFETEFPIYSSPAVGSNGVIYVGSDKLYAIDKNGRKKWSFDTGGSIRSSPAISSDGTIYVGSLDGKLYAINQNGTKKWTFEMGEDVWSSPAVGSDGTIYVGSDNGKLYAIHPDGTKKWSFQTERWIYSSPAIGQEGTIYVGSNDRNVYAINPDGTPKWLFSTRYYVRSSPAIGEDGTVYVGSGWTPGGLLYAINQNGTKKWTFETENTVKSSPAIGPDGIIYVASLGGKLYAIHGESGGLADTPWPMFHQDLKHTGKDEVKK